MRSLSLSRTSEEGGVGLPSHSTEAESLATPAGSDSRGGGCVALLLTLVDDASSFDRQERMVDRISTSMSRHCVRW